MAYSGRGTRSGTVWAMAFVLAALMTARVLLPLASGTGTLRAAPAAPPPAPLVLVLAGQSNMGGWAPAEYAVSPLDASLVAAGGTWTDPAPGSEAGLVRVSNGPGLGIARGLARGGVRRIGLVNCAVGGTGIATWVPGGEQYEACRRTVAATGLPVAGVVFWQGEQDAVTSPWRWDYPKRAADWGDAFRATLAGWRSDWGADLPVVVVRLAHNGDPAAYGDWATVQAQQDGLVGLPNLVLVDPEPVALQPGSAVHLDDASWLAVGERIAAAYQARWH